MRIILIYILLLVTLPANEIDNLLMNIEVKNDLSQKTKKENNGIVTVYTRSDLNMMGAKHLRDILKSSVVGFKISRYGLVDPNTKGLSPFASSNIRIFIDNQEISSTLYGSGIMTGDINLDFVDHIEIYTYNPSFEFTTEPTTAMIKLYTKTFERDPGTKISSSYGSYDSKLFSLNTANKIGDYSYMIHISKDVDNKKRVNLNGADTSRDTTKTHTLVSIYNDKRKFLLSSLKNNKDSFLSSDWTATPSESTINIDSLHIGYEEKFDNGVSCEISYDGMEDKSVFANSNNILFLYKIPGTNTFMPINRFDVNGESSVITAKLQEKTTVDKHDLLFGVKYRAKDLKYNYLKLNGSLLTYKGVTKQDVSTLFFEDNYNLADNSIITLAMQHSNIDNVNHYGIKDDDINLVRLGNTYIHNNLIFQSFLYYQETAIEPYLVNSIYLENDDFVKEKISSFIEKVQYTDEKNIYDLTYTYDKIKDYMRIDDTGLLLNSSEDVIRNTLLLRWTHNYSSVNKFFLSYYVNNIDCDENNLDETTQKVVLQNSNRYNKFDLFEELIVTDVNDEVYYDVSLGVTYNHNDNFTIQLNAENLFDDAAEQKFIHNTISSSGGSYSHSPGSPFLLSPIDRKVMLTMEYLF